MSRSQTTGKELLKVSKSIVKSDPEFIKLPLLSAFIVFLASTISTSLIFLVNLIFSNNIVNIILGISYLIVTYFIVFFFQGMMIYAANQRLEGFDPTLTEAKHFMLERFRVKRLISYALIFGTFGWLVERGGEKSPISSIMRSLVGATWQALNFFALPIILLEELSMFQSMKKSSILLSQKWSKILRTKIRLSLMTVGLYLLLILLGVTLSVLVAANFGDNLALCILLWVTIFILFAGLFTYTFMVYSSYNIYAKTVLYRYANNLPTPGIEEYILAGAFQRKE